MCVNFASRQHNKISFICSIERNIFNFRKKDLKDALENSDGNLVIIVESKKSKFGRKAGDKENAMYFF